MNYEERTALIEHLEQSINKFAKLIELTKSVAGSHPPSKEDE